ncbi:MAG TPA: zinc-binding dehydrogenase [Propionibacteriaceae bacterium]|nr:zinc-binding dehydrogenase [Propionibacteriaceae bacterium]
MTTLHLGATVATTASGKNAELGLLSRKVHKQARKLGVSYSFLFMQANGAQLRELATLDDAGQFRPVIGKTFPFGQTLEAIKTPVNFGAPSCLANPDPRWALLLAMMAIFLIAAHLSRVREQKLLSLPAVMST